MIVEFEEIEKLRREKTVCTAGTFDLFHGGHVDFLEYLRKKFPRHKVVVGVL